MSDDPRANLLSLIGRPDAASGVAPIPLTRSRAALGSFDAIHLVLVAHLRGLLDAGVIDDEAAEAIARPLETRWEYGGPTLRAAQQGIEVHVDATLPDTLRGAIGLGLAHEEWSVTVVRMVVRSHALAFAADVAALHRTLLAVAEQHAVTLMQGFHTGQPTQVVTFGHALGGAIGPLGTGLARLLEAVDRIDRSPLGAGSMSGEVVGADREDSAAWLGFREPITNTFDAVSNVEDAVALAEAVAAVAAPVGRLLDEVIAMMRSDAATLVLGDSWIQPADHRLPAFSPTERLHGLARVVHGVADSASAVTSHLRRMPWGPLGGAVDGVLADLVALMADASHGTDLARALFNSALTVNRAWLANRAGRSLTTSGDLAAFLMAEEGLTPSAARDIAGLAIRRVLDENIEISAITPDHIDTAALLVIGREVKVEIETLGRWFAPRRFLERRQALGSPAPSRTREWIAAERETGQRLTEGIAARRDRHATARDGLLRWLATTAASAD